eukprot:scaffold5327_cov45-Phaeocystis_antarctica.AAC.3
MRRSEISQLHQPCLPLELGLGLGLANPSPNQLHQPCLPSLMGQSLSNAKPDGSTAPTAPTAPHRSRSATPRRTSEQTLGDGREACSAAVAIETTHTDTMSRRSRSRART